VSSHLANFCNNSGAGVNMSIKVDIPLFSSVAYIRYYNDSVCGSEMKVFVVFDVPFEVKNNDQCFFLKKEIAGVNATLNLSAKWSNPLDIIVIAVIGVVLVAIIVIVIIVVVRRRGNYKDI